jgi:hypothetical protein
LGKRVEEGDQAYYNHCDPDHDHGLCAARARRLLEPRSDLQGRLGSAAAAHHLRLLLKTTSSFPPFSRTRRSRSDARCAASRSRTATAHRGRTGDRVPVVAHKRRRRDGSDPSEQCREPLWSVLGLCPTSS